MALKNIARLFIAGLAIMLIAGAGLLIPGVRARVRALVRPEPPARITPLAISTPRPVARAATPSATVLPHPTAPPTATPARPTSAPARSPIPPTATLPPTPTPLPTETPTPSPVIVNGRTYDAYIPAAVKEHQAYQYSCEFDAAWVILTTYGIDAGVDDLIGLVGTADGPEPYIEETRQGFIIHGGDITAAFSGDYKKNFLARSTGMAIRKAFEHYDLAVTPVSDRAGVEAALRAGGLVWMKTTVDFKPWRPAIWHMPDGRTHRTVLGNDHAVVIMGFNAESVVIRDVLGPTSSNWQRPYEYEVDWPSFLASWEAQEFDGLAVAPPSSQ